MLAKWPLLIVLPLILASMDTLPLDCKLCRDLARRHPYPPLPNWCQNILTQCGEEKTLEPAVAEESTFDAITLTLFVCSTLCVFIWFWKSMNSRRQKQIQQMSTEDEIMESGVSRWLDGDTTEEPTPEMIESSIVLKEVVPIVRKLMRFLEEGIRLPPNLVLPKYLHQYGVVKERYLMIERMWEQVKEDLDQGRINSVTAEAKSDSFAVLFFEERSEILRRWRDVEFETQVEQQSKAPPLALTSGLPSLNLMTDSETSANDEDDQDIFLVHSNSSTSQLQPLADQMAMVAVFTEAGANQRAKQELEQNRKISERALLQDERKYRETLDAATAQHEAELEQVKKQHKEKMHHREQVRKEKKAKDHLVDLNYYAGFMGTLGAALCLASLLYLNLNEFPQRLQEMFALPISVGGLFEFNLPLHWLVYMMAPIALFLASYLPFLPQMTPILLAYAAKRYAPHLLTQGLVVAVAYSIPRVLVYITTNDYVLWCFWCLSAGGFPLSLVFMSANQLGRFAV